MANDIREPRNYELMSILIPDMPDEDTQAAIETVNGYITAATGEVNETLVDSPWGRRRLAYQMRFNSVDYRDGYYVVTHFSATPNVIGEIERDLKLDTRVMRYLLVMDDPKAGEKATEQDANEPAAEAGEATDAPAAEQVTAQTQTDTTDAAIEETAADAAEQVEGEESPAPADAPAEAPASELPADAAGETADDTAEVASTDAREG